MRAVDLVIYTNIKSNFNDLTDTEKVSLGETSLSLNWSLFLVFWNSALLCVSAVEDLWVPGSNFKPYVFKILLAKSNARAENQEMCKRNSEDAASAEAGAGAEELSV